MRTEQEIRNGHVNVREIVEQYLRANGFDGMFDTVCECFVGSLMPCLDSRSDSYDPLSCKPGVRVFRKCSCGCGGYVRSIGPRPQPEGCQNEE